MPITGGCRCSAVRYEISLDAPPLSYACHCRDCQTWSGSAFAIHAMVPDALFEMAGDACRFALDGAETMETRHIGCGSCLTRIANTNGAVPGMTILRVGTLDRSDEVVPAVHIWTKRKQPWLVIPEGTPTFDQTPSPEAFFAAVQR